MDLPVILVIAFLVNIGLVGYLIKKVIYVAHKKHLFDEPSEERKIHVSRVPNLGGIALFGSLLITCTFLTPLEKIAGIDKLFPAALILFSLGLIDDLVGMDSGKKFLTQVAVALFTASFTPYRIDSFYGIAGIYHLLPIVSVIVTTLFLTLTINAINLSDGINGLAGSIALCAAIFFAVSFFQSGSYGFLVLAVALCGVLTGFLRFNISPARIFMGDTGAIMIGFILGLFSLHYLHLKPVNGGSPIIQPALAPAFVCALLIVPFFDTLRVFTVRLLKRKSPFQADRNHVHHRLIDLNLSHEQAVLTLLLITLGAVMLVIALNGIDLSILLLILGLYSAGLDRMLHFISRRRSDRIVQRERESEPQRLSRIKVLRRQRTVLEKTV